MASPDALAASFVSALPRALAGRIFAVVPLPTRLRSREVCRAWRDALADPAAWTRLDLSLSSGVAWRCLTDATLLAAASKAAGRLAYLDVRGSNRLSLEALHSVIAANASTLTELRACAWQLRRWDDDASQSDDDVDGMRGLRRLAPALTTLVVRHEAGADEDVGDAEDANPDDHAPPRLSGLSRPELDALLSDDGNAGAAVLERLETNVYCALQDAPALLAAEEEPYRGRLVLRSLIITPDMRLALLATLNLLPAESRPPLPLAALGAALRRSRLTGLTLAPMLRGEPLLDVIRTVLDACIGHPMLAHLHLHLPQQGGRRVIMTSGGAGCSVPPEISSRLGALVAANAPALHTLRTRDVSFQDADVAPLVDGLRCNTHLRTLDLGDVNSIGSGFAATRLLPVIRDENASLRRLRLGASAAAANADEAAAIEDAAELVNERPRIASSEARARSMATFAQKLQAFSGMMGGWGAQDSDYESESESADEMTSAQPQAAQVAALVDVMIATALPDVLAAVEQQQQAADGSD